MSLRVLVLGHGSFGTPILINTGTAPPMIAVADFDGDGKTDVFLADCCGLTEASLMLGNGDGSFQPELRFPSGSDPKGIALGDFNGDGKPGVAIIGQVRQAGASGIYTISVGKMASGGPISVTDSAPTGMTVTAMSGSGWTCTTLPTCTRSDVLPAGQNYPAITVTVSVAANAPSSLTNMATVSGGGSACAMASDTTSIGGAAQFTFNWTANPAAGGSVTPASGTSYATGSNITVTATANACYAFSTWSGNLSGNTNPSMLLMNAAKSVTANFISTAEKNVTAQMSTAVSGFRYHRITQIYTQSLTVTNNGAALGGPVYVALDSLDGGAVSGALGTTQWALPPGSPYVLVSASGIDAGQSLTLTLAFTAPAGPPVIYTPRYLAGGKI
jgi:hypothetical protein